MTSKDPDAQAMLAKIQELAPEPVTVHRFDVWDTVIPSYSVDMPSRNLGRGCTEMGALERALKAATELFAAPAPGSGMSFSPHLIDTLMNGSTANPTALTELYRRLLDVRMTPAALEEVAYLTAVTAWRVGCETPTEVGRALRVAMVFFGADVEQLRAEQIAGAARPQPATRQPPADPSR